MTLYLMRHGAAEDHSKSGRDVDRELTKKGRHAVKAVAEELRRLRDEPIGHIVTSPAARALETAELVQHHAGKKHTILETRGELLPDEDTPLRLARELAALDHDVLLVGHQPWIEALARTLAPLGDAFPSYGTSMLVGIDVAAKRMVTLIDPRKLA